LVLDHWRSVRGLSGAQFIEAAAERGDVGLDQSRARPAIATAVM
jgi:hypothetical protein